MLIFFGISTVLSRLGDAIMV